MVSLFFELSKLAERAPVRARASYDTTDPRKFLTSLLVDYLYKAPLMELAETAFQIDPSLANEGFLVIKNKLTLKLSVLAFSASREKDGFERLCHNLGMP